MNEQQHPDQDRESHAPTRRDFLKVSTLAIAAAATGPALTMGPAAREAAARTEGERANALPGRIILYRDPTMGGHLPTPDTQRIAEVVQHGVRLLTGIADTAAAFESIFPGLQATSRVAIKINCIGPTCTHWQVARGVVAGLAQTVGGTYDITRITIYDNHYLGSYGYTDENFTFDGRHPLISSGSNCDSGYAVWENHELSNYLLDADYVVNVPAVKSHTDTNNQLTMALKNHYGSCCPSNLCGDIPGMLALNSDSNVKGKTALVLMDGLWGTYTGGPDQPAQSWNGFPEHTPNTLFFSTDPVTNEYWGRDLINTERLLHGWSPKPCTWVETASGDPYNLGVSDPAQMNVIHYDPASIPELLPQRPYGAYLAPNVPNPFHAATTLRLRLPERMRVRLTITDPAGRLVCDLGEREYPEGFSEAVWNGRTAQGSVAPAGVYLARLEGNGMRHARTLLRIR